MAKQPSKNLNLTVNAVALEDDMDKGDLSITQEAGVVTSFADAGPRVVTGNYDYKLSIGGAADFASAQSDATLFALVGSTGVAFGYDPTGASAGANDPNYDATGAVLTSYTISAALGQGIKYTAELTGGSALTRTVA